MSEVKISRSIEGEPFQKVILHKELVIALGGHKQVTEAFVFLIETNMIVDEQIPKFKEIISNYEKVFREYGLNKYEVRANYNFDQSELINE